MASDIAQRLMTETLIGLCEAARRLPPGQSGRPVHFSCVFRWVTDGVPGPDGRRVKLEAIKVGRRWLTSIEALARWAERLTPRTDTGAVPNHRTPARRKRDVERAARELDDAGI
jgi:hypothetical protein